MKGTIVLELYEFEEDAPVPAFEYIPCDLSKCIKGKEITLQDLITRGFDDMPRKEKDGSKYDEILQKLEAAGISRITVAVHAEKGDAEPYVELTNVVPVSFSDADARRVKERNNEIILKGRYKLSDGHSTTVLKDAQRLTLIYSNSGEDPAEDSSGYAGYAEETQREITLNITYFQD